MRVIAACAIGCVACAPVAPAPVAPVVDDDAPKRCATLERARIDVSVAGVDALETSAEPSSGDGWTMTLPIDAPPWEPPGDAVLQVELPDYMAFLAPSAVDCCTLRMPATTQERRDLQLFDDDGALWFEVTSPLVGQDPRAGFHVRIVDDVDACDDDDGAATKHAFAVAFDDGDAVVEQGQTVRGAIDGAAFGATVTSAFTGQRALPQIVLGRIGF